jgi:hypothetical protein
MTTAMTRESLGAVIKTYGEELQRLARERYDAAIKGSRPTVQALLRACEKNNVAAADVVAAIEADRSLWELTDSVTREALVTPADTGPYDVISREASSGTPENKHVGAMGTEEVGLPWVDHWW